MRPIHKGEVGVKKEDNETREGELYLRTLFPHIMV